MVIDEVNKIGSYFCRSQTGANLVYKTWNVKGRIKNDGYLSS